MNNIKIGAKLIGGFLLTALIILTIGILSIMQQGSLAKDTNKLVTEAFPALEHVLNYRGLTNKAAITMRTLLIPGLSKERRLAVPQEMLEARKEYNAVRDALAALPIISAVEDEWKTFTEATTRWGETNDQAIALSNEMVEMDVINPTELLSKITEICYAHDKLVAQVGTLILTGKSFERGTDPKACPPGQWVQQEITTNPKIVHLIDELRPVHDELHHAVAEIKDLVAKGQMEEAKRLYATKVVPNSEKVLEAMDGVRTVVLTAQTKLDHISDLLQGEGAKYRIAMADSVYRIMDKTKAVATKTVEEATTQANRGRTVTIAILAGGLLLAIVLGLLLTRMITKPLIKGVELAKAMADGDLTKTMDVDQKDEIGVLALSLNNMATNLRRMFGDIQNGVLKVDDSSTQLAAIASQVASGAESTSGRSSQVAAAAEEMSANQTSIAAAMEQASVNINMVSSAAEEMNATINEIASNSSKGKEITSEAVRQSLQASERVNELGKAADAINKVTEVITDISAQTNLLALNATIEAARAGEAGKGFAVVANEIKDLAKQTAEATLEIKNRIQGIQQATGVTVKEINDIREIIADVDTIVATIATAVEEQTATTREIAENVTQASRGITEVNENVAQSSAVSAEIASDIALVNVSANEMTQASHQVSSSAQGLSTVADSLKGMMKQFKI